MLQVFSFESKEVRFVGTVDKPEWIAADVCNCLELANVSQATDSLDADEKGITIVDTLGGEQEMLTVTEPGLYSLIFKSRKAPAKRFKRWVFHDVLPSIRKTGRYETPKAEVLPPSPQLVMAELNIAEQLLIEIGIEPAVVKQLKLDNAVQFLPNAKYMLEAGKKLSSASSVHESVGLTPTQVGLKLKPTMKPREVNQLLENMGFQIREISGKKKLWQLTEEGKAHGFVYFATGNEQQWSGDQIRWQESVVSEIQDYLDGAVA